MSKRSDQRQLFPILMIAAGIVLILGSVLWLVNATQVSSARSARYPPHFVPQNSYPEVHVGLGDAKATIYNRRYLLMRGEPIHSYISSALSITII
jgi:hypothetical protein